MFLVRTAISALGTPSARDALVWLEAMERAGQKPRLSGFSGKTLNVADLKSWLLPLPGCFGERM